MERGYPRYPTRYCGDVRLQSGRPQRRGHPPPPHHPPRNFGGPSGATGNGGRSDGPPHRKWAYPPPSSSSSRDFNGPIRGNKNGPPPSLPPPHSPPVHSNRAPYESLVYPPRHHFLDRSPSPYPAGSPGAISPRAKTIISGIPDGMRGRLENNSNDPTNHRRRHSHYPSPPTSHYHRSIQNHHHHHPRQNHHHPPPRHSPPPPSQQQGPPSFGPIQRNGVGNGSGGGGGPIPSRHPFRGNYPRSSSRNRCQGAVSGPRRRTRSNQTMDFERIPNIELNWRAKGPHIRPRLPPPESLNDSGRSAARTDIVNGDNDDGAKDENDDDEKRGEKDGIILDKNEDDIKNEEDPLQIEDEEVDRDKDLEITPRPMRGESPMNEDEAHSHMSNESNSAHPSHPDGGPPGSGSVPSGVDEMGRGGGGPQQHGQSQERRPHIRAISRPSLRRPLSSPMTGPVPPSHGMIRPPPVWQEGGRPILGPMSLQTGSSRENDSNNPQSSSRNSENPNRPSLRRPSHIPSLSVSSSSTVSVGLGSLPNPSFLPRPVPTMNSTLSHFLPSSRGHPHLPSSQVPRSRQMKLQLLAHERMLQAQCQSQIRESRLREMAILRDLAAPDEAKIDLEMRYPRVPGAPPPPGSMTTFPSMPARPSQPSSPASHQPPPPGGGSQQRSSISSPASVPSSLLPSLSSSSRPPLRGLRPPPRPPLSYGDLPFMTARLGRRFDLSGNGHIGSPGIRPSSPRIPFDGPLSSWNISNAVMDMDEILPRSTRPASERDIRSLPVSRFQTSRDSARMSKCCICLESFQDNDRIKTLPCFHFFHATELDKWLKESHVCPMCRHPIENNGAEIGLGLDIESMEPGRSD